MAAVPILLIGILVMMGGLQTGLFMMGRHASEVAAFRASRVVEEGGPLQPGVFAAARQEADRISRIGYPDSLSAVDVRFDASGSRVTVDVRMEPLFPAAVVPDGRPIGAVTVQGVYPPPMGEVLQ